MLRWTFERVDKKERVGNEVQMVFDLDDGGDDDLLQPLLVLEVVESLPCPCCEGPVRRWSGLITAAMDATVAPANGRQ